MQNRLIEWYQEDQFASANLNRVDLFEIKGKRSLLPKSTYELPSQVSCISCNASRGVVAVGQQSGNISFLQSETTSSVIVYDSSAARRPCTAVSWNKQNPNQLAAGFEKSRSQGEFCAIVWDVEGGIGPTDKILFRPNTEKPTNEEPTASVCWLDAHVLVVGTSISWVRLYDVRVNGSQQGGEIMSIMAHAATRPRKVKGIRCDSLQQHIIATFSDSPGEPIKIWDLRKAGVTAKPKLMIVQSQVAAVIDVAWSAARAGVLAVATNQSRNVNFYSTVRPVTELVSRTPFHTITVGDPVKSLTWKIGTAPAVPLPTSALGLNTSAHGFSGDRTVASNMGNVGNMNSTGSFLIDSKEKDFLRSNRLLVATTTGFADLDVIESVGLGLGAGGCVAVGAGKHVDIANSIWVKKISTGGAGGGDGVRHSSTEKGTIGVGVGGGGGGVGTGPLTDVEILTAARCTAGYSIDAGKNLQVLSDEMDSLLAARERDSRRPWIQNSNTIQNTFRSAEQNLGMNSNLTSSSNLHGMPLMAELAPQPRTSVPSTPPRSGSFSGLDRLGSVDITESGIMKELEDLGSTNSRPSKGRVLSMEAQVLSLTRLWAWVDRVDSLSNEGLTVSFCGVIDLLASSTHPTQSSIHSQLVVPVYSSENRELAKELCGWTRMPVNGSSATQQSQPISLIRPRSLDTPKSRAASSVCSNDSNSSRSGSHIDEEPDQSETPKGKKRSERDSLCSSSEPVEPLSELEEMVAECEEENSFGRAAAIALFHGDLALAVRVLQRRIPLSTGGASNPHTAPKASSDYTRHHNGDDAEGEGEGEGESVTNHGHNRGTNNTPEISMQFTQLISLTAMCIAGFSNTHPSSSQTSQALTAQQEMWISMCRHVVSQLEAQTEHESTHILSSCCYLAAALRFLLDTLHRPSESDNAKLRRAGTGAGTGAWMGAGTGTGRKETDPVFVKYGCIVGDENLSLEDRVSFACTFLDDSQTAEWLRGVRDDCTMRGDLGGLVVTGLAGDGLDLLQQYLDRHDDLQTVALLVGRNVIDNAALEAAASPPNAPGASRSTSLARSREWQWLWEYRNLLNKMQLFLGRASLDVQLGKRNRLIVRPGPTLAPGSATSTANGGSSPFQGKLRQSQPPIGVAGRGAGNAVDRKSGSARILYQLPPHSDLTHVFLRCNYCSSSLPVDPLQQQQAAFFRKQRPLISCCANCKKPLPRCYVCLLYMGMVNPTHEFNRALVQRRKASAELAVLGQTSGKPTNADGIASGSHSEDVPHNVLALGQWFFFCQHCKHGGHAACIDDWFEGEGRDPNRSDGREVCGVNGCMCHCRSLK